MEAPPRSTPNSASMVGSTTMLDHKPTPPIGRKRDGRRQPPPRGGAIQFRDGVVVAFMSDVRSVRNRAQVPDEPPERNR